MTPDSPPQISITSFDSVGFDEYRKLYMKAGDTSLRLSKSSVIMLETDPHMFSSIKSSTAYGNASYCKSVLQCKLVGCKVASSKKLNRTGSH